LGASLDDLERMRAVDRSGMLKVQMSMPEACINALKLAEEFMEQKKVADYLKEAPSSLNSSANFKAFMHASGMDI